MAKKSKEKQLTEENQDLRARLEELEETLRAIQNGEVDALVISGIRGEQVYTLKDANQPYRVLVETMNEGTATVTPEGTVLYCNSRLAAMLKMPLEQVIGTSMRLNITESDLAVFDDLLKKSLQTDCQGELSLKAGQGTLPVQLSLSSVRSEDMDCIVTVITNLTEQKKAGRALRMLYECNQIITRATNETDSLRDICRTIVEVGGYRMAWVGFAEQDRNKTVRPVAQTGYEDGYLETMKITWDDSGRGRGSTGTAIRTGEPSIGRNFLTDPDLEPWRAEALRRGYASSISIPMITAGQTFGALTMYAVEPDAFDMEEVKLLKEMTDNITYCISALRIRAEHKRTEEELRKYRESLEELVENRTQDLKKISEELARSNADLQQFAYAASHDLQEPLRGVEGFAKLFERRYKGKVDEKADEFIDYMVDGVKRMQTLIQDLLEYSQVAKKGKRIKQTGSSLAVAQALANLQLTIEENSAVVTHDTLPKVMADSSQLTRLFQNLIGNAIKFRSAEPPEVHISAEQKGGEWVFSVRDNGIGIDPKFKDGIFVIFQRLHTRDAYSGTGIGLAVCKKIVELHGGKIWVESEPGKGSTFYFTIPADS